MSDAAWNAFFMDGVGGQVYNRLAFDIGFLLRDFGVSVNRSLTSAFSVASLWRRPWPGFGDDSPRRNATVRAPAANPTANTFKEFFIMMRLPALARWRVVPSAPYHSRKGKENHQRWSAIVKMARK